MMNAFKNVKHGSAPLLFGAALALSACGGGGLESPLQSPDSNYSPVFNQFGVDSPTAHTSALTASINGVQTTCGDVAGSEAAKMVDGTIDDSGWACPPDTTAATVSLMLDAAHDVSGVRIYADFGSSTGQGPQLVDVTLRNAGGDILHVESNVSLDETLQATSSTATTLGPDTIAFTAVAGVRQVDVALVSNWMPPEVAGETQTFQIRELEVDGTASVASGTCNSGGIISSITVSDGLSERDAARWPVSDLCDGRTTANDGFASHMDEDRGTISVAFGSVHTIDTFSIWNDFGVMAGQGATQLNVDYLDANGATLTTVGPFVTDPANDLNFGIGEHFSHAPVAGVKTARIRVGDNTGADNTGLPNSLNLREVRFADVMPQSTPCKVPGIKSVTALEGFSDGASGRWKLKRICDGKATTYSGWASDPGEDQGVLRFDLTEPTDLVGLDLYNDFGFRSGQGAKNPYVIMYNEAGFYTNFTFPTSSDEQIYGVDHIGGAVIPGIVRIDLVITDNYSDDGKRHCADPSSSTDCYQPGAAEGSDYDHVKGWQDKHTAHGTNINGVNISEFSLQIAP